MTQATTRWTNKSVLLFARGLDPIKEIEKKAREAATKAMDLGWCGPPYDPIHLAEILKARVVPRADIRDARTVSSSGKGSLIEFNPTAPRWRVRFSIAHEIAHTFFPDCGERVRNRGLHAACVGDDWQLELLCNVAAGELLMPIGSFPSLRNEDLSIERLVQLRETYDVSIEALLMRTAKLAHEPCSAFFCTRIESGPNKNSYRLDYLVSSRSFDAKFSSGVVLNSSLLSHCASIGFTSSGSEKWFKDGQKYSIQCVGIPPLPGGRYPRIAGILKPSTSAQTGNLPAIQYVRGDVLSPRGQGHKVIAHIINDQSMVWGGKSFASNLRRKWPEVQADFQSWARLGRSQFSLGSVRECRVDDLLTVVSMVAQRGFGPSDTPRIRYSALENCLFKVAEIALRSNASVHMPTIGVGNAGGAWPIIEELIIDFLCKVGLSVTVYSLPQHMPDEAPDGFLTKVLS